MRAAIVSIGDELVLGQNLDTNSRWLSAELAARGVRTIEHRTIDDDEARIAEAIRDLAGCVEVIILTGGLGPTDDDLTRSALAAVLAPDETMVEDAAALEWLDAWFAQRGRSMPATNRRQAQRPRTMRCLPNPHGTAPGLAGEINGTLLFALPGPPHEMRPMFEAHVLPALTNRIGAADGARAILTATVHEFGMGESAAAERISALTARDRTPLLGMTFRDSIVTAIVRAEGDPETIRPLIDADLARIEQAWWPYAYGRDSATLPEVTGALMQERGRTLVTAESCTGGWLGKAIVDVAGSSAWYFGGWVTYSNAMKIAHLGVPEALMDEHGAVSEPVAEAMARGALARSRATDALAITGIAGPDGGTKEKPVGLVYIAHGRREETGEKGSIDPENPPIRIRRYIFAGDRATVRDRAVKTALQMLRFSLIDGAEDARLLWETPQPTARTYA